MARLLTILCSSLCVAAALLLPSCEERVVLACFDAGDCNAVGESSQACVQGACVQVECLSSASCPYGTWCDTESDAFSCLDGCRVDGDCPAGSACESGSCEALPCRQANLDCNFNEFCDPVSGECVPTPGLHCAACDPGDNIWSNHGTEDPCDDTIVGHPVCGEEGSVCANSASFGDCWVACSEQSDCPGGYTCEPVPQATPGGCAEDVLWVGPVCRPNGSCEFE